MKMGHRFLEYKVCHGSSLEQRVLSCSHTAPLGLPGCSTSAWKVRATPAGVCIITCIPDLWDHLGAHFRGTQEFPSTTAAVQIFCLCRDEAFLLALGKRCLAGWRNHALTLQGLSPAPATAVGTQQSLDQPHETWPSGREEPPKPIPLQGPLGRDPAADNRRWVMDSFWERNDVPPSPQEAALVPGSI